MYGINNIKIDVTAVTDCNFNCYRYKNLYKCLLSILYIYIIKKKYKCNNCNNENKTWSNFILKINIQWV